jgi:hypothetical protein
MDRKIWTTPFGLALMIGSALALIAGYAYGTNAVYVEENVYNAAVGPDNLSDALDENLLIDANREPAAEIPVRQSETPASAPPSEPSEKQVEVPDTVPVEPDEPDEPPVETVNESGGD